MIDRDAIRTTLIDALEEHGLSLDEVVWKENLKKRSLSLGLKISGELDEQQELPFVAQR